MHTNETEIVGQIYRLTLAPTPHFEFSQFLLLDQKTCLVHTGKISFFEPLREMVQKKLDGRGLDYIVFSHVEADESGAVNKWLDIYPQAQVVCNKTSNISLGDFLIRPARILQDGETLSLGAKTLQLINTPHFPHNWDAHMWFETMHQVLFSSDFCGQGGVCAAVVEDDISATIIDFYVKGGFTPYGKTTNDHVERLAKMPIRTIAPMHGSLIAGNACKIVLDKVQLDLKSRS